MSVLRTLSGPADLNGLSPRGLAALSAEIREFLIASVCRSGGHLGSNLGIVELTLAVHRVFESPTDPVVFDVGHQAYPHKLVTGRLPGFERLRQHGGLAGYPSNAESVHDVVSNSHASTALAYADGLAKAFDLGGETHRVVVAVVGDGALTGGLAWEALNNLGSSRRRVVVVLNDNGRSYAPTAGGVSAHLRELRDGDGGYGSVVELLGSHGLPSLPRAEPGRPDQRGTPTVFEQLGLRYLGPVDGHDQQATEHALHTARRLADQGPVVVHCVTAKGTGYPPAEDDDVDHLHTVGVSDPATGRPVAKSGSASWTAVFGAELTALAHERADLVAVTAAMTHPTGLVAMAEEFPDRVFDVGIAEQHAVAGATGLAMGGRHPVVAVYSTFLNRAFDQLLFDAALHEQPVTFAVDRAGITGPDGPSHHGMWDLAVFRAVPGMRVAAPRDADRLREELREAVAVDDGPTAVRFPKATAGEPLPAVERTGGVDVLRAGARPGVLLVTVGVLAAPALDAARRLAADGTECTVVDPRWVLPVAPRLVELAAEHELVVTVEDGVREGGVGDAVARAVADAGLRVPVRTLGLPTEFVPHGGRGELLASAGLDADGIAAAVAASHTAPPARAEDPIAHENFPVALRVLPHHVRDDLVALYRYARYVDDVGDEAVGERHRALDAVDADLDVLFAGGTPGLAAVRGLRATVARRAMPDGPFRRLVDANRRDQVVGRYATFEQLREYCRLSADPVGELVLYAFGAATPERVALSDRVCTALQIIEHLQDVKEDYRRDRVYLPKEDMDRFAVVEDDLAAEHASPALRRLVAFEARRAERLLDEGAPLLRTLSGWARVCVTGYVAGGRAALGALARAGYDPLPGPPRAGKLGVLSAALALSVRRAAS